jgi:hypothetical protein
MSRTALMLAEQKEGRRQGEDPQRRSFGMICDDGGRMSASGMCAR